MIDKIKKWWKFSTLRFYIINALWNYKFWLCCTKEYHEVKYYHYDSPRMDPNFVDQNFRIFDNDTNNLDSILKTKRRFIGYKYKGQIYMDNPGVKIQDKDVWNHWRKKGLI
jgi:hypothetical protein